MPPVDDHDRTCVCAAAHRQNSGDRGAEEQSQLARRNLAPLASSERVAPVSISLDQRNLWCPFLLSKLDISDRCLLS